jgi:3-deoxy-manno-octulosonate cytidylyltransferase (CMP-KDO synthetase)
MDPITIVIPARMGSTRFPAKMVYPVAGKPLIFWVLKRVVSFIKDLDFPELNGARLILATDHPDIAQVAHQNFPEQVTVHMTPSDLPSGTDRMEWALRQPPLPDDALIINVQGDEPLVELTVIQSLVKMMQASPQTQMGTLATSFANQDDYHNPNQVKVLINAKQEASYFSRYPIPYSRSQAPSQPPFCAYRHLGFYAYRYQFLKRFCSKPPSDWEKAEGLEQLRALQMGEPIKVTLVEYQGFGIDTEEDMQRLEKYLTSR